MDDLLRKIPSPLFVDGILYRLTITKLKGKWLVSYDAYRDNTQLVWRFNPKLYIALQMMIAWLYQKKLMIEEDSSLDLRDLSKIAN